MASLTLPNLVDDARFWPVLQKALECLTQELDKAGGPARCYTGFTLGDGAGTLGLINCRDGKCGGVAWVRAGQAFPSDAFPAPAEFGKCASPLAMTIEMGVARCAPRAQGTNMYPDPQATFNALRLYMSDQAAMNKAICCVEKAVGREYEFARGSWDPLDQAAGISGGTWTFTVG
jgi:hypothetical protein